MHHRAWSHAVIRAVESCPALPKGSLGRTQPRARCNWSISASVGSVVLGAMLLTARREVGAAQPRQGTAGRAARGIFRIAARPCDCSKEKGNRDHDEATLGGLAQARAEVPSPSFPFQGSRCIFLEGQADCGLHLAPLRRGAMDEFSGALSLTLSRVSCGPWGVRLP